MWFINTSRCLSLCVCLLVRGQQAQLSKYENPNPKEDWLLILTEQCDTNRSKGMKLSQYFQKYKLTDPFSHVSLQSLAQDTLWLSSSYCPFSIARVCQLNLSKIVSFNGTNISFPRAQKSKTPDFILYLRMIIHLHSWFQIFMEIFILYSE